MSSDPSVARTKAVFDMALNGICDAELKKTIVIELKIIEGIPPTTKCTSK
jgi:hypothetical protein